MEKRVDRNKELYREIEAKIARKKKEMSNSSFDSSQSALSAVNPDLFGSNSSNKKKEEKKFNRKLIIGIACAALVILVAIIVVVIVL